MKAEETDVFISYRRVDGRDIARTIQLAIQKRGFENVFFDYSSMRNGAFNTQIYTAIENCKDFLLVLSPLSMQRCAEEGDWVAIEIEKAISVGCNIIPIAINEPFDKWPDDFPRKLSFLKRQQMLVLRTDDYFESSIEKLIGWFETKPTLQKPEHEDTSCSLIITVDETCELFINDERIRKIKKGSKFSLSTIEREQRYKITIKSLANNKDVIEQDYKFPVTQSNSDSIEFSFSQMREKRKLEQQNAKKLKDEAKQQRYEQNGYLMSAARTYDKYIEYMMSDGMLPVSKNYKVGFLNNSGLEVIPCRYDNASGFKNGYATVELDNKWYLLDTLGEIVSTVPSDSPCTLMPGAQYYSASKNGKYNIFPIKKTCSQQPTFPYEYICYIEGYSNLFLAMQNELWMMVSIDNKPVPFNIKIKKISSAYTSPVLYYTQSNQETISTLKTPIGIQHPVTKKWGYLNSKLELTVPFADEGGADNCYSYDLQIICCNNKMGVVNTETGAIILPTIYTFVIEYYDYPYFLVGENSVPHKYEINADGIIKNDWWRSFGGVQGVCDLDGNFIIPCLYQWIEFDRHDDSFPFFIAYKLSSLVIKTSNSRHEYYNSPLFDEQKSEAHIYACDGRLLHKGRYSECIERIRDIIRKCKSNSNN